MDTKKIKRNGKMLGAHSLWLLVGLVIAVLGALTIAATHGKFAPFIPGFIFLAIIFVTPYVLKTYWKDGR